ncbi:MAG: GNAT family N-acetyltransferase [Afipia sp.]|nr:GNAT family N-acetyltransferase [Afipia sp.]
MIRVIDHANGLRYRETLDRYFRFRHEIFVRERAWTDFEMDGQYEVDQYDNEKTIYHVALDDKENVTGCFRLYPTTSPHMISEAFPHLVEGAILERPDVFEISRISIAPKRRHGKPYYELLTGLQEYGLQEGLSAVTAVILLHKMPIIQSAGFTVYPLGLPKKVGGKMVIAIRFDIDEETLSRVRCVAKTSDSVLEFSLADSPPTRRTA